MSGKYNEMILIYSLLFPFMIMKSVSMTLEVFFLRNLHLSLGVNEKKCLSSQMWEAGASSEEDFARTVRENKLDGLRK